jgi:hypothetical protein
MLAITNASGDLPAGVRAKSDALTCLYALQLSFAAAVDLLVMAAASWRPAVLGLAEGDDCQWQGRTGRAAAVPAARSRGLWFKGQTIIPNGRGVPLAGQELTRPVQKAVALGQQGKKAWTRADVITYLGSIAVSPAR